MPEVRLIAPDLPGHGSAPEPAPGVDFMDAALDRVRAVLPQEAIDVVGHSYGGALGLRLLADCPKRVRSLTVIEPVMFAAAPVDRLARHWRLMDPFDEALARNDREAAAKVFNGLWGDGTDWERLPHAARTRIAARIHLIPRTVPGLVDDCHRILPRLTSDGPPVVFLSRIDPPDIVAAIREGLAKRLPDLTRVEKGPGHMLPLTHPAEVASVLRRIRQGWRKKSA